MSRYTHNIAKWGSTRPEENQPPTLAHFVGLGVTHMWRCCEKLGCSAMSRKAISELPSLDLTVLTIGGTCHTCGTDRISWRPDWAPTHLEGSYGPPSWTAAKDEIRSGLKDGQGKKPE